MLEEILHVSISDEVACENTIAADEAERNTLASRIVENMHACRLDEGCSVDLDGNTFTITGPKPKLERIARWLEQTRAELVLVIRGWNSRG